MKKYIKSDGNGNLIINKPFAFISIILTIAILIIQTVFGYGVMNNKVDTLGNDLKLNYESFKTVDERVDSMETRNAVIMSKLDSIQEDLNEIRLDIKELKKGD